MAVTPNCDKMGKEEDEGPLVPVKPPQGREISIFKGNCRRQELLELIDKRMGSKCGAGFDTRKRSRVWCVCLGGGLYFAKCGFPMFPNSCIASFSNI